MEILRRIVCLILFPRTEFRQIATETPSVDRLIRHYILPLSLLAPIATVVGMKTFDAAWDPLHGYTVAAEQVFAAGATTLFASIGSVFVLAAIFVVIAPMYGSRTRYPTALAAAAYGAVPVQLAGVALVVPSMIIVSMVALCHTLYLYYVAAHELLGVPEGARTEFVGISMVFLVIVSIMLGAAASASGVI
jgi:hypothetical protein